jgi:hypothetical protein
MVPWGREGPQWRKPYLYVLKKIFSRTSRPISIKFGTNHPWVKKIKNCSKKGAGSFPRGDNHRNTKIGWDHFKMFFSRTTEPEELIFT